MLSKIIVGALGIFATVAALFLGMQAYVEREIEFHKLAVGHADNRSRPQIQLASCKTEERKGSTRCEAICSIGKSVVAGGCEVSGESRAHSPLLTSAPNAQRNGWICEVAENQAESPPTPGARGFAYCADVSFTEPSR